MILTEKDKALFKSLEGSATGKNLKDFLERLCVDMCDIRTWKEFSDINAKAVKNASLKIETEIIDRIKSNRRQKKVIEPFK